MNDMPEKRFRYSPVSASVWAKNTTKDGKKIKFYSVSISRVYKKNKDDKNGNDSNDGNEWQYTKSFRLEDLPKVALVANEAYKYIILNSSNPQAEPDQ